MYDKQKMEKKDNYAFIVNQLTNLKMYEHLCKLKNACNHINYLCLLNIWLLCILFQCGFILS